MVTNDNPGQHPPLSSSEPLGRNDQLDELAQKLLRAASGGHRASLAKALTMVERGGAYAKAVVAAATAMPSSDGYIIGLTGAPGAGKSTLTGALISAMRSQNERAAVLAIDPTSPFTGGAILGDRVRMTDHALDPNVYIRSMATRGNLGGLNVSTPAAVRVLHAAGWPWVIIETVGVGQVEVDIAAAADTTVVVLNPGWGDEVQANKAGLMEIADIFVVNKADRDGAKKTRREVEAMLNRIDTGSWRPPVLETVATTEAGAAELWQSISDHKKHISNSGELVKRRNSRAKEELNLVMGEELTRRLKALRHGAAFAALEREVVLGNTDPWSAAEMLLNEILGEGPIQDEAT